MVVVLLLRSSHGAKLYYAESTYCLVFAAMYYTARMMCVRACARAQHLTGLELKLRLPAAVQGRTFKFSALPDYLWPFWQ
jgi:hypothetical protein